MKAEKSLNLLLNKQASDTLDLLVEASNASCDAEVIRNAIALFNWAREQMAKGLTVGAFKDGVPVTEVILPFEKKQNGS